MINGLNCRGRPLDVGRPLVMGILNVTPDSFSDGGCFLSLEQALTQARRMAADGADLLDIGGESTRPGAAEVSVQQELDRVIPLIETLSAELPIPLSVDTSKPEVMLAAVAAGAGLINDVYALRRPGALQVAAALDVPVCLMHMQGEPRTMQADPSYEDVLAEVSVFFRQRMADCEEAGIPAERIVLDPGFGFGKTLAHNLSLLQGLNRFVALGRPLLVGLSRKSMIGALLGDVPVPERLIGSVSAALLAWQQGASFFRVHDVKETVQAFRLAQAVAGFQDLDNEHVA